MTKKVIIDCIADMHGYHPPMQGGDLLIVAGDHTANNHASQWVAFFDWLKAQKYRKKIIIGGNHDNFLSQCISTWECVSMGLAPDSDHEYLADSGLEFEGLKIWGSPWTPWFKGINPHCRAFTASETKLIAIWHQIPVDTDILITHGPPKYVLDKTKRGEYVGSHSLSTYIHEKLNLKLHVFGHIHEGYGQQRQIEGEEFGKGEGHLSVNCSYINSDYEPVNKPIRVIL